VPLALAACGIIVAATSVATGIWAILCFGECEQPILVMVWVDAGHAINSNTRKNNNINSTARPSPVVAIAHAAVPIVNLVAIPSLIGSLLRECFRLEISLAHGRVHALCAHVHALLRCEMPDAR